MLLHVHERRPVSDLLDGVVQSRHHGLSITEQHHRFVHVEQIIVNPGVSNGKRTLDDHHGSCLVSVNDGHSCQRTFACSGGGVAGVVGADDNGDIALGEFGVDFIHPNELFIRNIGFCKQDVHVARHATSNGVNGVLDLSTELLFEQVAEFFDLMLAL